MPSQHENSDTKPPMFSSTNANHPPPPHNGNYISTTIRFHTKRTLCKRK